MAVIGDVVMVTGGVVMLLIGSPVIVIGIAVVRRGVFSRVGVACAMELKHTFTTSNQVWVEFVVWLNEPRVGACGPACAPNFEAPDREELETEAIYYC